MVSRWDPFSGMVSVHEAMNRLFNESFISPRSYWAPASGGTSFPFDLYESENEVVVRAAIPGADPSTLDLTVDHDVLTLRGYRTPYSGDEEKQYHWHVRALSEGEFQFSVTLPVMVDAGAADASFDGGIVTIRLPKAEEARAKRIAIRTPERREELPAGSS